MITDTTGGAISENPDSSMLVTHAMVFGPYSLNPGEKAKIIFAFAAGSGADWHNKDEITWSQEQNAKLELKNATQFQNQGELELDAENLNWEGGDIDLSGEGKIIVRKPAALKNTSLNLSQTALEGSQVFSVEVKENGRVHQGRHCLNHRQRHEGVHAERSSASDRKRRRIE